MGVRLESKQGQLRLDLGDIETLTQPVNPSGAVSRWQQMFTALPEKGIAGIEIFDDEIEFTSVEGQRLREPLGITDVD
ncbi:hypothetical protein [Mycobacterium sp. 1245805.9]|uniref:hypothetical protein n=1 Tax=Mycobacterium sp. 1245805.9 TaxID=1856862 RepID=UPI000800CD2A|nr:hypothetical protein [Mycobacterium sp. 1245805.9]OBI82708.1 hypothetical protein A9X00_07105 [Mycobacterium sp. 1245805.9]